MKTAKRVWQSGRTWNRGRHNISYGGDFRRLQFNQYSQSNPRGTLGFTTAYRVRVYRHAGVVVVVATDTGDGTRLTRVAETLATELERRHSPDPAGHFAWIEHRGGPGRSEAFARVTFARAEDGTLHEPRREALTRAAVEALIGEPLAAAG